MNGKILLLLISLLLHFQKASSQLGINDNLLTAIRENNLATVKMLIENGADINAADSNHASMLMWAVYKADLPLVKYLVSRGADHRKKGTIYINDQKTSYYGNLTGIAAGEGNLQVLKFLLEELHIPFDDKEYDNAAQTETGWTALQWAASSGHLEIVKFLVQNGAEKNTTHTSDKGTPLSYALQNKHSEVAQFLISSGTDVNRKYADGATALMYAVLANDFESCVLLWKHKANLNEKADNGVTAAELAIRKKPSRIVDFFKKPAIHAEIAKEITGRK